MRDYWKKFINWWEARKNEERLMLVAVGSLVIVAGWYEASYIQLMDKQGALENRVINTQNRIQDELRKAGEIQILLATDPNVYALNRQHDLVKANADADLRLDKLYGELIDPRQMSLMLTSILQRETSLQLVSLENRPSESLLPKPLQSLDADGETLAQVQVYRHGLKMVFKGDYLETLRYLQSLEKLDNKLFWESLEYSIDEYPAGKISLEIYTLSTQKGWIGV